MAPEWDQYASSEDVKRSVNEAARVYKLYGAGDDIQIDMPADYNRLSPEIKDRMVNWVDKMVE